MQSGSTGQVIQSVFKPREQVLIHSAGTSCGFAACCLWKKRVGESEGSQVQLPCVCASGGHDSSIQLRKKKTVL